MRVDNFVVEHVVVILVRLHGREAAAAAGVRLRSGDGPGEVQLILVLALPFGPQVTILPETLGEGIVVNLQLGDPLVLVGGHAEELGLSEGHRLMEVVGHDHLEAEQI